MNVTQVNRISSPFSEKPQVRKKPEEPSWQAAIYDYFKGLQNRTMDSLFPASLLPQDPVLKMKRLENGLTYYVRKNAYPFPGKANFQLVIRAGHLNEAEGEKGIAHLIEHIAQIETAHFSKDEIMKYLNSKGVHWARDNNAYTSSVETVYKLDIPLDDSETLEKVLFILSEVASKASLSAEVIENEKEIVIDELKLRQNVSLRYYQARARLLCEGTPYASLLDREKEIKSVKACSKEAVRSFYHRWYRPENIAIIAVGDFDPDRASQLIEKHFGNIPASKNLPVEANIRLKSPNATRILCFSDPELTRSGVEIHYQLPEVKHRGIVERKNLEMEIKTNLFKMMLNQRLADLSEKETSPFVNASSSLEETIPNWTAFSLCAQAKEGKIPLALMQLLVEVKRIKTFGFTNGEFDRAKKALLAMNDHWIREKGNTMTHQYIEEYHSHFMQKLAIPDVDERVLLKRKILEGIDLKAVNSLASYLMPTKNSLISTLSPKKPGLDPITPEHIKKVIGDAVKETPSPLSEEVIDQVLLKNLPVPKKIGGARLHKKINAVEYTLKNGLRVFVKPTLFEKDGVAFQAWSLRGVRDAKIRDLISAKFSEDFFDECGIGDFDRKTLRKMLQEKRVSFNSSINHFSTVLQAESSIRDFETSLQLFHLLFTHPRYDRASFEKALKKKQENLRNETSHLSSIFIRELIALNTQNHPESQPLSYDDLKSIDYEACKQFHRKLHSNPADFTAVIVGNIQKKKARELIERYLATIPTIGKKSSRASYSPIPMPSGISRKNIDTRNNPGSFSVLTFPAPIKDTFKEICLSVLCCDLLERRLNKALRFDMGKTYSQTCQFSHPGIRGINPAEPSRIVISFTGEPGILKTLEKKAIEEIRDLQENGPTDEEIRDLKKEKAQRYSDLMKTNQVWIATITANCEWNSQQNDFEEMEAQEFQSLTPLAAKEHFKKIFTLDNYTAISKLPISP